MRRFRYPPAVLAGWLLFVLSHPAVAGPPGDSQADLEISQQVSPPMAPVGSTVAFLITVSNRGPDTAEGVVIEDKLPAALSLLGATVSQGQYTPSSGVWAVGTLAEQSGAWLSLTAVVERVWGLERMVTNPVPGRMADFGRVICGIGSNRLAVSAPAMDMSHLGRVYVLDAWGQPLATLTNPSRSMMDLDGFGWSLSRVGVDMLAIGSSRLVPLNLPAGRAWLFDTNGLLVTQWMNPRPQTSDAFGSTLAAVGTDRALVGAPGAKSGSTPNAGAAYLYHTNGTLLAAFTNLVPQANAYFGSGLASVGDDRFWIGEPGRTVGGVAAAGVVHVFDANGDRQFTIENPRPGAYDIFGASIFAMGDTGLAISARGWDPAQDPQLYLGVVYFFDTNGILRAVSPEPAGVETGTRIRSAMTELDDGHLLVSGGSVSVGALKYATATILRNDGQVLATLQSPTPGYQDDPCPGLATFGANLLALGNLGFSAHGTGREGIVYLFGSEVGGTVYTNTARVVATTAPDPFPANNISTAELPVGSTADLRASKVADPELAILKGPVTYTITLANDGPEAATGIVVFDLMPPGVELLGAHTTDGSFSVAEGRWEIPHLAPGGTAGLRIDAVATHIADMTAIITNPAPAYPDAFGAALASVGDSRFLVGAPGDASAGTNRAGAVYLYDTNGLMHALIENPSPDGFDEFGLAVCALGNEIVAIGAPGDNTGVTNTGSAYLFDTNGVLVRTLREPGPLQDGRFGQALCAVGTEWVAVADSTHDVAEANEAGVAYLFHTNDATIITVQSPNAETFDEFGTAVTAIGASRFAVSAPGSDMGGTVHVFNTNGSFIITIPNPVAAIRGFGQQMTGVGEDQILIGAPDNPPAGIAYRFDLSGQLLATISNPSPGEARGFGQVVQRLQPDLIAIGTQVREGAAQTGNPPTYLFNGAGELVGALRTTNSSPSAKHTALLAPSPNVILVGVAEGDTGAQGLEGLIYRFELSTTGIITNFVKLGRTQQLDPTEANNVASAALELIGAAYPPPMMLSLATPATNQLVLTWVSIPGSRYAIERTTNLLAAPFGPVADGLPATPPVNSYTDSVDSIRGAFYRVREAAR